MVFSFLRRFFSSKSSSSAYRRLHSPPPPPLPIYHGDYRPLPITPPRPVPTSDGDRAWVLNELKVMNEESATHCSFGPVGACGLQETTPPRPVPTGDGDCGWALNELKVMNEESATHCSFGPVGACALPETTPPRPVPTSGGSGDEEKTSAMYRIENELKVMNEESATDCSFGPVGGDIFRWEGVVIGPAHSYYDGGIFTLSIDLPSDYPYTPPRIKFQTKIFHPNIEEDGTIHIDILEDNWSPALTIEKLLLSICSILSSPEAQGSINEASMMYKNEYLRFCEVAREWTKIYAMPS